MSSGLEWECVGCVTCLGAHLFASGGRLDNIRQTEVVRVVDANCPHLTRAKSYHALASLIAIRTSCCHSGLPSR